MVRAPCLGFPGFALLHRGRRPEGGVNALQPEYAPVLSIAPRKSCSAVGAGEFQKFLLQAAREEVEVRTANSTFVHLWNEMPQRTLTKLPHRAASPAPVRTRIGLLQNELPYWHMVTPIEPISLWPAA